MVSIVIKGYIRNGYSAMVYNQRCRDCGTLGKLDLDQQSYVDRVAYRLRKWAGVSVEKQDYAKKEGPPHESAYCEGCKKGVCRQGLD